MIDLTAPLSDRTPIIQLPPPFANTPGFALQELSRYDDRGPAWYWNAFSAGEHVGTHFDAPVHWVTGQDGLDVSQVPPAQLLAPGRGHRQDRRVRPTTPTSCSRSTTSRPGRPTTAGCPTAAGCCTAPAGTSGPTDQERFLNADDTGPHTPGLSAECARWLAEERPILGIGVETVGTDAGRAHSFDPPFPCHSFFLGNGKYGLTQLANLSRLPATGAVVVAAPLPIVGGSGSPCRVLALVERG